MSEARSLVTDARRKLVEGTEVLRTGGGAHLTSGECNAILDRLADLEQDKERLRNYISMVAAGLPREQLLEIEREFTRG